MLIVFTIAVTPKLYLHNVFTHHKDQLFLHTDPQQKSIVKYEYSCGFINTGIERTFPFVYNGGPIAIGVILTTVRSSGKNADGPHDLHLSHAFLRGPPAYIFQNCSNRIF
ncbi:hypothetical protein A8C56_11675 [Niabella ginsenosidivorans]|uniref:Uncharacterized protein n=1 Tax=Niabella ginsenosidivorans TaxID=1176587 RepID=A0A1A9I2I7_9BACT|nr:hypothetical protein A8C56_11675 [Niabella ginsenosidivorans]